MDKEINSLPDSSGDTPVSVIDGVDGFPNGPSVAGEIVEEAFQRGRAEMGQIFDFMALFMIRLSPEGMVDQWTAMSERLFDVTADQALGRLLNDCPVTWDWKRVEEGIAWVREKVIPKRLEDVSIHCKDRSKRLLSIAIIPVTEGASVKPGLVLLGYDVTQRSMMEMDLAETRKLESVVQLASGIARQINTPIQYMGDNIRFLAQAFESLEMLHQRFDRFLGLAKEGAVTEEQVQKEEKAVEEADWEYLVEEIPIALAQTHEGLKEVSKIVDSMQKFSNPFSSGKMPVNINAAVESIITITRHEWKDVAEMVTELDPSLPLVSCLGGEVNQALVHLVMNAIQALAEARRGDSRNKGVIKIKTRQDGDHVEISVQDTGPGIPDEIGSRVFDPFFTTKDHAKHVGQGLTAARTVMVDKHGGSLNFVSEVGESTTFVMRLPL